MENTNLFMLRTSGIHITQKSKIYPRKHLIPIGATVKTSQTRAFGRPLAPNDRCNGRDNLIKYLVESA